MEKETHFFGELLEIWEENKHEYSELKYISGELRIYEGVIFETPNLTDVESIHINKNSILKAPKLNNVDVIYIDENAKLDIPLLEGLNYRSLNDQDDLFVITSIIDKITFVLEEGYIVDRMKDGVLCGREMSFAHEKN